MDKEKIIQIINEGENEKTEFKLSFNKQLIQTLVAFANTKGEKTFLMVFKLQYLPKMKMS